MSGKVDGILLECTTSAAAFYPLGSKTTVQIIGSKELSGFSLTIDDFKGVGTYNVSGTNMAIYLKGVNGLQDAYLGITNGTIKIISYTENKILTGTFEFKGENSNTSLQKTITEGKFSINLVPVKLPETNSTTNNLSAKVDGIATGFTGEATSVNSPLGQLLSIVTINGDKRMVFGILGYKGVGNYTVPGDAEAVYMKDQSATGSFSGKSGTLKITSEANNKLKGTFSFIAPNENSTISTSVTVTEGSFELPLSKK